MASWTRNGAGRVRAMVGRVGRFGRRDDGGAIIFTLFFISVLLLVTGYAVDSMRFENKRTRLQATLDSAVLAAANLGNTKPCEEVIEDYFDKAGLLDQLGSYDCEVSPTGKTATASASMAMGTFFMNGVDTLVAPASGAANENVMDIEIVLVLDVTGSMGGVKIVDLRKAAQDFTDKVLGNDVDDRVSIAVVPYNMQVHLGQWLIEALPGVVGRLGLPNRSCIDLPQSAWSTLAVDPGATMPQQPMITQGTSNDMGYVAPQVPDLSPQAASWLNCNRASGFLETRLPSQNIADIKAHLGSLQAGGNTSIFLGMKWGVTLLDPLMRPIYGEAISDGLMPSTLAGRPYDYGRQDTLKVVVLMTDGEHVPSSFMQPGYHTGPSGIYRGEDGNYAIYHPGRPGPDKYFVAHLAPGKNPGDTLSGWKPTPLWPGSGIVTHLGWEEVWKSVTLGWVTNQLYGRPLSDNGANRNAIASQQRSAMVGTYDPMDMDAKLLTTCDQAKAEDVLIFTIAFHAPQKAETLLRNCASGVQYYYEPVAGEIGDAFDSIANTINVLRLTQ